MAKKRKRPAPPLMLFWTRRDQRRFIDAVERFSANVHDLSTIVDDVKRLTAFKGRRKPATTKTPAISDSDNAGATTEKT